MGQIKMVEEILEGDVLCVGGGIAGLMAAIGASDRGARVIVAEKANTLRSGAASTGNDHFRCYIPEYHGSDIDSVVEETLHSHIGGSRTRSFVKTWLENTFNIIKMWDSWGIPMKYKGKWEFAGHVFPGQPPESFPSLKYAGSDLKPTLTKEARKRGVQIVNRVMIFDLLCDDGMMGAIGIHTREDKIVIFRTRSVLLTTGTCTRLYPGVTPGWMFNRADSPHTTGDGRAMAYRAGAELIGLETPIRWAGPKYFARCGKASWVGVLRDPQDNPVGPFVEKPDKRYGDPISDIYRDIFEDYAKAGKGPVSMDCRGISEEDHEYMMYWMNHEGLTSIVNHLEEQEIDLKENPVEFMTYEMTTRGGIYFNERGETSVPGLYAAGDEYFGGGSCAATIGWLAGQNAAHFSKSRDHSLSDGTTPQIEQTKALLEGMRNRSQGATWQEINIALQQVMFDYAGALRYKSMLDAGYRHLRRIREQADNLLTAVNPHELMHCLEVLNLLDIGELVFLGIHRRKESREKYARMDYPYRNPLLDGKIMIYKKGEDGPVIEWKKTGH
ncbi:MAG: FAD-binding protein [Deltaproteobacteria bacterium]|nr:FAD-binding protein [Deltaproteobacteria bacterium]